MAAAALLLLLCPLSARAEQAPEEGAVHSVTEQDVTVTMATDKQVYAAGEEIHYTITVENNRDTWDIKPGSFSYSNTDGLVAADGEELPTELPEILSGESAALSGTLVGDAEVFGAAKRECSPLSASRVRRFLCAVWRLSFSCVEKA